jgi:hypothetical protein
MVAMGCISKSIEIYQDIIWETSLKFDSIKLSYSMSLLKLNGTRSTVNLYAFYGFGKKGDITQLIILLVQLIVLRVQLSVLQVHCLLSPPSPRLFLCPALGGAALSSICREVGGVQQIVNA